MEICKGTVCSGSPTGSRWRVHPGSLLPLLTLISVFLIATLPVSAFEDPDVFRIHLLSPPEVEAEPREVLTASVQVTNDAPEALDCRISVIAPPDWQYIADPELMELDPGTSQVAFVSVILPVDAAPGQYNLILRAIPEGVSANEVRTNVTVTITGVARLDVQPGRPSQPDASTGDELAQTFTIANLGNATTLVAVDIESIPDWRVSTDPPEAVFELGPNQTGTISVRIVVPDELARALTHRLTVIARPLDADLEIAEARTTTTTRIVPSQLIGESMYTTLSGPIETRVATLDGDESALALTIGPLEGDLGEGRHVSVDLRNLLIAGSRTGTLIQRQRLSAEYVDDNSGYVRLGDFSIDYESPLIARYMWGRGGEILMRDGSTEYRAFYTRTRGSSPVENTGAQLAFHLGAFSAVRLTAVTDQDFFASGDSDNDETSTSFGIFAGYSPSRDFELTGELAHSNSSTPGSENAWRFSGRYRQDDFSASGEWLRAGEGFHGGWTDTELRRVNLAWSLHEDINLWTNYSLSRNNLENDPDESARNERNISSGATLDLEGIGRFRVSRRLNRAMDALLNEYNRHRNTTVYSLTRDLGVFTTTAAWQEQIEEHLITDLRDTDRSFRLDCSGPLGDNASVRLGYTSGRVTLDNGAENYDTTNIHFGGRIGFNHEVDLSWDIHRYTGEPNGRRTNIYSSLRWDLMGDRELNLFVRDYSGVYRNDTEMALEYSCPLSIPLRSLPRMGSVMGRVYMTADPDRGIPLARIIVGNAEVLTDEQGNFAFPSLEPGEYQLTLDLTTLRVGLLPQIELPLIFTVEAGSTVELEIPVIETVDIGGRVLLGPPTAGDEGKPVEGFAGVLIELRWEGGTDYRFTDLSGRFNFADLLPREYEVILRSDLLPRGCEVLGPGIHEVRPAPGESLTELSFSIAPEEREIVIVTDVFGVLGE